MVVNYRDKKFYNVGPRFDKMPGGRPNDLAPKCQHVKKGERNDEVRTFHVFAHRSIGTAPNLHCRNVSCHFLRGKIRYFRQIIIFLRRLYSGKASPPKRRWRGGGGWVGNAETSGCVSARQASSPRCR
jgi:hypothetical protein